VSIIGIACVLGAIVVSSIVLVVQLAMDSARVRREAAAKLPTCKWRLADGQQYVAFLSHYKVEAGAQARYLKDSLDKMLACPAYLDSSTLADLRKLFAEGVHTSEVLVLLLSHDLLTRPWCLLEIREAMEKHKPIVLLQLTGPGQHFSFDDAWALIDDLEGEMPARNPYCLDELRLHLGGMSLTDFQQILRAALEQGRAASTRIPHLNINGTSNQLEAELVDLVECLAEATGRKCEWQGGSMLADQLEQTSKKKKKRLSVSKSGKVTILHDPEAAEDALRLREGMEHTLGQRCDVSVPLTVEAMVRRLETDVALSQYVLLLQTRGVLSQPWALLAAYRVALVGLPMACVVVNGGGYDFGGAKEHLEHLSERLDAASLEQLTTALSQLSPPRTVTELQKALGALIPHIISVVYNPTGSDNELAATVHDIRDKQSLLQSTSKVPSFSRILARLGTKKSVVTTTVGAQVAPSKTSANFPSMAASSDADADVVDEDMHL